MIKRYATGYGAQLGRFWLYVPNWFALRSGARPKCGYQPDTFDDDLTQLDGYYFGDDYD